MPCTSLVVVLVMVVLVLVVLVVVLVLVLLVVLVVLVNSCYYRQLFTHFHILCPLGPSPT